MKADNGDPNFINRMHQLLGLDKDAVEKILDELDANDLTALTDAIAKDDAGTAKKIVSSVHTDDVNSLFRGKDIQKARPRKKKKPGKMPANHEFAIGDDVALKSHNDKTGKDEFVSATVYLPNGPHNTVGVKIDGARKMVKKDKLYSLNEMVMGMVGVPNIQRMQQLAGIQSSAETSQVEIEPAQEEAPTMDDACPVAQAMQALDVLSAVLPDIRLGDMKEIRRRFMELQTKLNESITTAQPQGRARKL